MSTEGDRSALAVEGKPGENSVTPDQRAEPRRKAEAARDATATERTEAAREQTGDAEQTARVSITRPRPDTGVAGVRPRAEPAQRPRDGTLGCLLTTAAGLIITAVGYRQGWRGSTDDALRGLWVGLLLIYLPCAYCLLRPRASRVERIRVAVLLGLGLLFSRLLLAPRFVAQFDELLHVRTLTDLTDTGRLFVDNPLLPASPRYPGLELLTDALLQTTGLPRQAAVVATLVLARILLVYGLFILVERLTGSHYAAGIGVLAYTASQQFYFFNAQFAYQTLAVALLVGILALLAGPEARSPRPTWAFATGAGCLAALTVTHHLSSWCGLALLGVWAVRGRRGQAARTARILAALGLAAALLWLGLSGELIGRYIGSIFSSAADQIRGILGGSSEGRKLFADNSGTTTPTWEKAALLLAALCWLVALVPTRYARLRRHLPEADSSLYRLMSIGRLGYPLIPLGRFAPGAGEITSRASTFIFLMFAGPIGLWLASLLRDRPARLRAGIAALSVVPFLGGLILGSGPDWARVPGPHLVAAEARSVDSHIVAAVDWIDENLPERSRVAGDRMSNALLDAGGRVWVVSNISSPVSAGPLFFGDQFGEYERSLLRDGNIQYVLVDTRLATSAPRLGGYVEPGEAEPGARVTARALRKFDATPGSVRVYDDGVVRVYDVTRLWQPSPLPASAAPTSAATSGPSAGDDSRAWRATAVARVAAGTLVLAALFLLAVLLLGRDRAEARRPESPVLLWAALWTTSMLVLVMLVLAVAGWADSPAAAFVALGGLAAAGLFAVAWRGRPRQAWPDPAAAGHRRSGRRVGLAAGAVVVTAAVAVAWAVAYDAAGDALRPDTHLSARRAGTAAFVEVSTGPREPAALRVEATAAGRRWVSARLSRPGSTEVRLPQSVVSGGLVTIRLLDGAVPVRSVSLP
jgi:hypothetical protein